MQLVRSGPGICIADVVVLDIQYCMVWLIAVAPCSGYGSGVRCGCENLDRISA